jgi:tetratricopeptide (TPR) repeat protein
MVTFGDIPFGAAPGWLAAAAGFVVLALLGLALSAVFASRRGRRVVASKSTSLADTASLALASQVADASPPPAADVALAVSPAPIASPPGPPEPPASPPATAVEPADVRDEPGMTGTLVTAAPAPSIPAEAPASVTATAPRVFVSHSTLDNEFGLRLAGDLRKALGGEESSVWFDASGGLRGGDVWLDQIAAELTDRDVFLIIISPAALASAWVQDELRMAWKQRNSAGGKVIIPVLYQPCAVPEYLATIQYVSFLPPRPYEEALVEVLAAVRAGKTRDVPLKRQATTVLGPPNDVALLPSPERFVGRANDLAWALARLRAGGASAITALRGLGGIGKTTLAGVAVRQLQQEGRFPDGIAVVLCQNLTDPVEVLRRILIRFDPLRRAPEATELSQLQDLAQVTLRGKQALVVLDNVEPALAVASVVSPLREAGLTVLLTARHALPSAVVPGEASRALDLLSSEEALELFAGALGRSGVSALTPAEHTAAEQIVAALGRHTLAVRLAGAYAAAERRDLGALARELSNPTQGLALPGDDETPEAVRRSFALSLDSLSLDARRLFAGLAAFATPECGRQAALALGSALGQAHPETSVHLLVVRALAESDRERLRLHPLVWAVAEGLFRQWPLAEQDAAALAVAQYLATFAEGHQTDYAVLAADEGNLTGALEWAHTRRQTALVVDLAHGPRQFWRTRGRWREGVRYLALGARAAEASRPAEEDGTARRKAGELHLAYGQLLVYNGKPRAAELALQRSLEDFRAAQDRPGEGAALSTLGEVRLYRGQFAVAEEHLQQSLQIAREVGDRAVEGNDLGVLGQVAMFRGQYAAAEDYLQRGLAIARELHDRQVEGVELTVLGQIAQFHGRHTAAEEYLQQALPVLREAGDRQGEGACLAMLGQVALARGQLAAAEEHLQQGLAIARAVGDRQGEGACLGLLGQVALARRHYDVAEDYLQQALAILREVGNRQGEGAGLGILGQIALARRHYDVAESNLQQSLAIAREVGNQDGEGADLGLLGHLAVVRERYDVAEDYLQQSLAIAREVGHPSWEARSTCSLGFLAEGSKDPMDLMHAETLYRQSWALATERELGPDIAKAQQALGRLLAEQVDRREEGCALLQEAARRFEEMGMPEAAEAREVEERLGCAQEPS